MFLTGYIELNSGQNGALAGPSTGAGGGGNATLAPVAYMPGLLM
jgi:hypothetical protein